MDAGYITAVAALVGSLFGSLAPFVTTYFTQRTQRQNERVMREVNRREELYGRFLDEATRLLVDAMRSNNDDPVMLVGITGMMNRMRLLSTPAVLSAAESVITSIVTLMNSPNFTLHETDKINSQKLMQPLANFGDECRRELDAIT